MKNKIIYISLLVLFSSSCKKQTFQLDDIILACYDSKYQEEGYDIKAIIEDYEKYLVKEGVLNDDSGKSYLEVLQKIASNKNFQIEARAFQDPFFKVNNETKLAIFDCEKEMIASAKEKDSKWHKLLSDFESPEIEENPERIYQVMAEALSENDFNSYYLRLKMLHLFDGVNSKWGNRSLLPPISSE